LIDLIIDVWPHCHKGGGWYILSSHTTPYLTTDQLVYRYRPARPGFGDGGGLGGKPEFGSMRMIDRHNRLNPRDTRLIPRLGKTPFRKKKKKKDEDDDEGWPPSIRTPPTPVTAMWQTQTATHLGGGETFWTASKLGLGHNTNLQVLKETVEREHPQLTARSVTVHRKLEDPQASDLSRTFHKRYASGMGPQSVPLQKRESMTELAYRMYINFYLGHGLPIYRDNLEQMQKKAPQPRVSRSQFEHVLMQLAPDAKAIDIKMLFDAIDTDLDGFIYFENMEEILEPLADEHRENVRVARRRHVQKEEEAHAVALMTGQIFTPVH